MAKGAWTCVKRHFYELGRDIDEQILTVVGVGEIGSEAFGGAMLQSSNIRLIGAFNADYIFVDPTPDRIAAFGERKRLFDTPGSTWRDYNPFLISAGGGVFSRSSKNIMLSLEAQELLGTRNTSLEGDELIRLLLKLPVDLLWMGGIGTYVKASFEVNETVADRANDTARVSAPEIKAKVVGEAASLGFTQRARVEYARKGGRINTDAIDHSGSVDLSDHEVNIKILMLSRPDNAPLGANRDERYRILREVADEVGQLVVHNNYTQCLCLSLERARCLDNIASFLDVADLLENAGFLNRSAAPFPLRKEAASREAGLMRPELAILIANAKLAVKRMLIETSSVLDEDWAREFLAGYFPERLRRDFSERLHDHPLAHEIAATVISNKIIDQAGVGFLIGPSQLDASSVSEAVGIYIAFDKILQGDRWRHALHSLDGNLTTERQYELLLQLEDALAFLCRWTWEHGLRLTPDRDVLNEWDADLRQYLNYLDQSREFGLLASGAPDVSRVLFLNRLRDFPVLVHLTKCSGRNFLEVVRAFDNFTKIIGLREIAGLIEEVRPRDKWERRLQSGLDDQLRSAAARFVEAQLKSGSQDASTFFETFGLVSHHVKFQRLRQELDEASPATLTPFAALASQLDAFVDACATAGDRS
ncbi:NAD-glutamate dehydrogenase domain-containing protein [Methylocystis sp. IM2]|uniref:NAD-glutamate dehydrogenase domain-containing protein n=2 Tax=Methylocystis sp. IM2 TaxID=3136563 RepID=UPI0030F9FB6D